MIVNGFKNLASAGLEAGIKFKQLENLTSGGGSGTAPAKTDAKAPAKDAGKPKVEEKKPEPKVEEDVGLGGDLFGDFWEWYNMPKNVKTNNIRIVVLVEDEFVSCYANKNC